MSKHHRRQDGVDPVLRTRARRRALQAVYAWQISGASARDIVTQFAHEQAREIADLAYFEDLVHGVETHLDSLDAALAPHLDRGIDDVDPIERAALRIAAYEFARRQDVPYRVVINEGVELAKKFGATEGHKFVNAVLDRAARSLRAAEQAAAGAARG